MLVLMGSCALKIYTDIGRKPADVDILGTYDEVTEYFDAITKKERVLARYPIDSGNKLILKTSNQIIEAEIAWPDTNQEMLYKIVQDDDNFTVCNDLGNNMIYNFIVPNLNVLYMLKMSHRYKKNSPHFLKTMNDIHKMRALGACMESKYMSWYEWREKDTYNYKHPKLNVSKGEFFDNNMTGVYQVYDHDSVHIAIAHLDKPAYNYFKPDEAEVFCSKELFDSCDEKIKLYSVVEEAMVLAIERALVPFPDGMNPDEAFKYALMKVCTSISSGWWREYAWEHYYEAVALYEQHKEYYERFKKQVELGNVIHNEVIHKEVA